MVVLTGKVIGDYEFSHETMNEKFFNLKLQVTRTSGTNDIINLIISDRMLYDLEDCYIGITGTLRSYNVGNGSVKLGVLIDTIDVFDEPANVDINSIEMEGYICKKTDLRVTDTNRKICTVTLAVRRPYGKSDYVPCIFWNRNAAFIDGLDIGSLVSISGRLQSRNYIKNDTEMTTYEVSVQELK